MDINEHHSDFFYVVFNFIRSFNLLVSSVTLTISYQPSATVRTLFPTSFPGIALLHSVSQPITCHSEDFNILVHNPPPPYSCVSISTSSRNSGAWNDCGMLGLFPRGRTTGPSPPPSSAASPWPRPSSRVCYQRRVTRHSLTQWMT